MPVFDIDDLSFFRALGLGLRHVERERGIKESRDGGDRGDAVSLSNYGHDPEKINPPLSIETCKHFQIEVERFILSSYSNFHMPVAGYSESNSSYNDAAFLLMDRGDDARYPYDFGSYPLGKCGTKSFSAKQVILLVTSDQYNNDDVDHAAYNTFIDLKNRIRQLKIHAAQQLLERFKSFLPDLTETQFEHIQAILKTLISYYQNNIFIESMIFIRIFNMASKWPEKNRIDETISTIQDEISKIAPSFIKTDSPILIKYQLVKFDELTISDLKLKLIHYIQNQNLSRVNDCLARLPKKAFTNTEPSPLQYAASLPNTEILRVVYHYDPDRYDALLSNKYAASPVFLAGYHEEQSNLEFLLQTRKLEKHDIMPFDAHIFEKSALKATEKSYNVIKCLIEHGAHIGNDLIELHKNPMAQCIIKGNDWSQKILELMLPLADYRSKYLGILSATHELYFEYGRDKRPSNLGYLPNSRTHKLQQLRNIILCSLTKEECEQINNFSSNHSYSQFGGSEILLDDLINHELKIAQTEGKTQLAENIKRCFENTTRIEVSKQMLSEINVAQDKPKEESMHFPIDDQSANNPPPGDNKHKIQKILVTLKENIAQKKHGRSAWFSRGVDNKVTQLTKVETWLAGHSVNKENESIVLGQIRDACTIKRNELGFFKPHSLTEYKKLLDEHQLTYPGHRPL